MNNMLLHRSPALEALCYVIEKLDYNSVLDLGHAGAGCIHLFSSLHCRLQIEDLNRLIKTRIINRSNSSPIDQLADNLSGETQFDIVLMWDLLNYMQPIEISRLLHKLLNACKPNTLVYCLSYTGDLIPKVPRKINVKDNCTIELSAYPTRRRDIPLFSEQAFLKCLPQGASIRTYIGRSSMLPEIKEYLIKIG